MGIYSKEREREALAYINSMIESAASSCGRDPQAIHQYIKENNFEGILEFMRDGDEWKELVIFKLQPLDIEMLDESTVMESGDVKATFNTIVNRILFTYFMEDMNDVVHEIDYYLEQTEGEPTRQEMEDEWNRDFEKMR